MTKLQKAKAEVRRRLESARYRAGACYCEGKRFDREVGRGEHYCIGPREVNEVLVTRRVFQKLSNTKKAYFFHEFNCSLVCRRFHQESGHSREFREWFEGFVRKIYSDEIIDDWIQGMPLKIKEIQ